MILKGNPVSTGIAVGNAFLYQPSEKLGEQQYLDLGEEENQISLLEQVFAKTEKELLDLTAQMEEEQPENAGIFLAHKEILQDIIIKRDIEQAIRIERKTLEYAIDSVFEAAAASLEQTGDDVIAARAADLRDVRNRLLRIKRGGDVLTLSNLPPHTIIVAKELLPSDTALLDKKNVLGIITENGGVNSHTAIIARSMQIPAILGVEKATTIIKERRQLIMDAMQGEVIVEPDEACIKRYMEKAYALQEEQKNIAKYADKPAKTLDGCPVEIGLNIGSAFLGAASTSYDFIGLLRTEFLYMKRGQLPTEEEQFRIYRQILEQAEGKTVTLRTLDIGGDKSLPYLSLPQEQNPFLGKRALRFCLENPDIFKTQLHAALRASAYGSLQLMFPMVSSIEDIRRAKAVVHGVMEQLDGEKIPYDAQIGLGIMIEIPSIALMADMVAKEVDFASIGTNDLIQYLCAADRMNAGLAEYYQPFSPAGIRLLGFIFEQFAAQKKPISVCGELAANPKATALLIGLGANKLSMSEGNILQIKATLASISTKEATEIAQQCKKLRTQQEVETYLQNIR